MHEPIKILFLSANPRGTARLQLDEELRVILAGLQEGERARFAVAVAPALRTAELPTTILRENPDLIHYSGHGGPGELILAADADNLDTLGAAELGRIFQTFAQRTRCVVLSACFSATVADAIAGSIPVVVGMRREVPDRAAREFAAGFYSALASGGNLTQCFAAAQFRLERAGGTPALAQLTAAAGVADALYFTGARARSFTAPPPPQASGWAALSRNPLGFEPLDAYGRQHGLLPGNTAELYQKTGDIRLVGDANELTISSSVTGAQAGAAPAHRTTARLHTEHGDIELRGNNNRLASTLAVTLDDRAAEGTATRRAQAEAQLGALHTALTASRELAEELKPTIAALLTKLLDTSLGSAEAQKLLRSLRSLLALDAPLLTALARFESTLLQLS